MQTASATAAVSLTPLELRQSLDEAISTLMMKCGQCVSKRVLTRLRNAYQHLQKELEQVDMDIMYPVEVGL